MTPSTTHTAAQPHHARSIRDVVEQHRAQVNEVFCRKIFRQLLASLELQYGMRMPHRAITPDTVVVQENGEPMLLPSAVAAGEQQEAADLHALAAVVHFAITAEWPPGAPLRPRGLAGYSDSLLGAVDKCLAPDPGERPRSISQLRNLLGIVALGPSAPGAVLAPAPPAPKPLPAASRASWRYAGLTRVQRWALVGVAAGVLLAALAGLVALLHTSEPADNVVLALPPAQHTANGLDPNETLVSAPPPGATAQPGPAPLPSAARPGASLAQAPSGQAPVRTTPPAAPRAAAASAASAAKTEYKLVIKPWGTLFVDGQERGVSPPVKRLVLAAGKHTVRIVNPAYPDRVLRVDAGRTASGRIAHDFSNASR